MGRNLVNTKHGWAVFETVSEYYGRTTRWCKNKFEIIEALVDQGIPSHVVEMFDKHNHLPSMMIGGNRDLFSTLQIDRATDAAGLSPIKGEPMEYLHKEEE